MSIRSFEDDYFDSILCQALRDVEMQVSQKAYQTYLQFKDGPHVKVSLRHQWRMKKIQRSFEKYGKYPPPAYAFTIKRMAVAVASLVIVVGSTTVLANADLSRFFQWLGFYSEEFVDISLSKGYTERLVEETKSWTHGKVYVPSMVPDGYSLVSIDTTSTRITLRIRK